MFVLFKISFELNCNFEAFVAAFKSGRRQKRDGIRLPISKQTSKNRSNVDDRSFEQFGSQSVDSIHWIVFIG